ncbi:MAG: PAS domain S-box protein [Candidatus Marinimicrobia bacterium]|nr:PAS domain S-box protein [Candidatus Neomarinimicrobiota bacterium]
MKNSTARRDHNEPGPGDDRFEAVANASVDGLLVVDGAGIVLFANPAAIAMFSALAENLVGFHFGTLAVNEPAEIQLPGNGEMRHVELRASALCWNGREATLAILRDITSRRQMEEALRKSDQTTRALLDATADAAFLIDPSGTVLAVNEETARRVGQEKQAMLGRDIYSLLPPEVAARRRDWVEQVVRSGEPLVQEDERAGTVIHNSLFPVFGEGGHVTALAVYGRDITEQRRAEKELRESEARFRSYVEHSPYGVFVADGQGRYVDVNPAAERITGYSAKQLTAMRIADLVAPESREPAAAHFRLLTETGEAATEAAYVRADGSIGHWTVAASRIGPDRYLGFVEDITERKRAGQALRESEERFRMLIEASPMSVMMLREGKYTYANPAAARLMGYDIPEQLVGMNALDTIAPEHHELVRSRMNRVAAGEGNPVVKLKLMRPDGRAVWSLSTSVAVRIGGVPTAIVVGQDISPVMEAEQKLRESEALFHSFFTNLCAGSCLDEIVYENGRAVDYRILDVNPAYEKIMGIAREKAVGALGSQVYGLTEAPFLDRLQRVAETGEPQRFEAFFEPIGKHLDFTVSRPSPGMFSTVFFDITERKQAEERLAVSEEKFRLAFMTSPDSININRLSDGLYLEINEGFLHIMGYKREDVIGHTSTELNIWKNPEDRQKLLDGLRADGYVENLAAQFCGADGAIREGLMSACVMELKGEPCILSITRDITARKQAETAKAEQQALLEAIYRNAPLIMMVVDAERKVQQINGFASQFADRSREEMLGLRGGEALRCLHALDDPRGCGFGTFCEQCAIRNTVLDTLENGTTHRQVEADYYAQPAAGRTSALKLLLSCTPLTFKGRRMALVTMLDVTERMILETELRQAQKMESVGRLAGGVAHDFNNMLMGIMGYTDMCREEIAPDHPIREWLDEIKHEAERSADLTRQLLAFARKQTIAPRVLDLNDEVAGMLKMLRRLIGEDIDLSWAPGAGLWPVKLDSGQVGQILANLCVNARDAISGVGKVVIETRNVEIDAAYCAEHPEAVSGSHVMLAISDDGCGMDQKTLAQVFDPFFTTKGLGEGTGLGLATVYGIVKQNAGFVNVHSEPGQGATFQIYLPRFGGEHSGRGEAQTTEALPGGSGTVMLVEDERSVRVTTARFIEQLGYTVLTAETPAAALRLAAEHEGVIDLLITDVVMPGMNGRDLAAKLAPDHPHMKMLFMSGYTADAIAHRGILDEGVHFLSKPFTRDDIAHKVHEILKSTPPPGRE